MHHVRGKVLSAVVCRFEEHSRNGSSNIETEPTMSPAPLSSFPFLGTYYQLNVSTTGGGIFSWAGGWVSAFNAFNQSSECQQN
jgi:hypothetical protein